MDRLRSNPVRVWSFALLLLVAAASASAAGDQSNLLVMVTDGTSNVGARAWDGTNRRWSFLNMEDLSFLTEAGGSFIVTTYDDPYLRVWGWATGLEDWWYSVLNVGSGGHFAQIVRSDSSILLLGANGNGVVKGALAWDGENGVWGHLGETRLSFVAESEQTFVVAEAESGCTRLWAWSPGAPDWRQHPIFHDESGGVVEAVGSGGNILVIYDNGEGTRYATVFDKETELWSPALDSRHGLELASASEGTFLLVWLDRALLRLYAWSPGSTFWQNGGADVGTGGGVEAVIVPKPPCTPIPCDADCDGDRDLFDVSVFLNGFTGPAE